MRTRARTYEAAAAWFRIQANVVTDQARRVGQSFPPSALAGGRIRDVLDDTLGVSIQNFLRVAHGLESLAAESERRAAVCRAYEVDVTRFEMARAAWQAMPLAQRAWRPPSMPSPPAPWVQP